MLSICIPVYNFDVNRLVHDLQKQADQLNTDYEILLIDDCSSRQIKEKNKPIASLANVSYLELESNIGRSAIRNLLAQKAKYRYLIFMDCDAEIIRQDYIEKYLECCKPQIVCYGGRKHPDVCPSQQQQLRWLYGHTREDIPAKKRQINPNESFITFNFLIDKDVFLSVKFDERLKSYGHEDTLFGLELERQGIIVKHIDNPLLHIGLEDSESFIKQNESSIRNLVLIQEQFGMNEKFINSIRLLKTYHKIEKLHLNAIGAFLFHILRKDLRKNLLGTHPKIFYFDLYKLGYLCCIKNKDHKKC
ncbi:MAG: glycosyltransferase family 2 protein [Dysgonomonas sp.]